ncbi:MAG TPA: carboxypeptidase-like regulatory domain-containing protein [Streptosporangiaceae bacterium]|nr:carboxypeptidase-like regulatory domain-containing protein [Streptosporangiaceae bacterium]
MKSTRLAGAIVLSALTVVLTVVLTAACGSQVAGGSPAAPGSGTVVERPAVKGPVVKGTVVKGTVAAGPVLPVSRPGQPDNRPVRGATVEALRGGEVVAVTRTDAAGRYELRLNPGAYLIVASSDKYLRGRQSRSVSVSATGSKTVDFVLDTGIR